jgi:hypothetical protein
MKARAKTAIIAAVIVVAGVLLSGCLNVPEPGKERVLNQMLSQQPSPDLTPTEVVKIQINALRMNNESDDGIAVAFRFASPDNRRVTGPLPRFARLVKSSPYSPLLYHSEAYFSPLGVSGQRAVQLVGLKDEFGGTYLYVFVLSKQTSGEYKGCWMTDEVYLQYREKPDYGSTTVL